MYSDRSKKSEKYKAKKQSMKTDIILAGVGGQGILSIAAAIGLAALEDGLNINKQDKK